jgi:hypothetical protein
MSTSRADELAASGDAARSPHETNKRNTPAISPACSVHVVLVSVAVVVTGVLGLILRLVHHRRLAGGGLKPGALRQWLI